MLSVQNLEVVYQDVILVLRGVSFEIPKGKIVSLLGSNGSGKTTVIRSITGLLDIQNGDITKGEVSFNDNDITNMKPSDIVEYLGTCQDTAYGATDSYGDGCNYYDANPYSCGMYDTSDFNSMTMCCGCDGGVQAGESKMY